MPKPEPEFELKDQELVTSLRNLFAVLGEDKESINYFYYASIESMFFDIFGNKEEIVTAASEMGVTLDYVLIDQSDPDPNETNRDYIIIGVSCATNKLSFIRNIDYFDETVFITSTKDFPSERFYYLLEISDEYDYVFEGTPIDLKNDVSEIEISHPEKIIAELN